MRKNAIFCDVCGMEITDGVDYYSFRSTQYTKTECGYVSHYDGGIIGNAFDDHTKFDLCPECNHLLLDIIKGVREQKCK